MIIKFKVTSFRQIPNPYGLFKDDSKQKSPEMFIVIANVDDIPDKIPTKTNPREQNMRTKVAAKIREGLLTNNSSFYLLNRGILMSVKEVKYDPNKSEITLIFENESVHGIVDGGHTYRTIIENRQRKAEDNKQYVKLEILTGIEDIFEDLAAARNQSVPVDDTAIAELKNKFDIIKNIIKDEPFFENIAFKENEDKPIEIDEIITILHMFNIDKYGDMERMPVSAYSSKSSCVKDYLEAYDKNAATNQVNNPYYKMKTIMVDIFKLYDYVESGMAKKYREYNNSGQYGRIKGVEIVRNEIRFETKFYKQPMDYKSPKGFLYPIINAFRALVKEENGFYQWKDNPFSYFDEIGKNLVGETVERSRTLGNNPNAVGKDTGHWKQLYQSVLTHYLLKQIK